MRKMNATLIVLATLARNGTTDSHSKQHQHDFNAAQDALTTKEKEFHFSPTQGFLTGVSIPPLGGWGWYEI